MDHSQRAIQVGLLILLLAVGTMCGLYVVFALKRWLRRDESIQNFTLQELRELRERGELTSAEFEALRGELIARVGRDPEGGAASTRDAQKRDRRGSNGDDGGGDDDYSLGGGDLS